MQRVRTDIDFLEMTGLDEDGLALRGGLGVNLERLPTPTELSLQLAILRHVGTNVAAFCPNYTPVGWGECDVWTITKSGYVTEYEIKVSKPDFMADMRKTVNGQLKHDLLAQGKGPSRFWYVVTHAIGDLSLELACPAHAGLIVVEANGFAKVRREAPRLNKTKVTAKEIGLAQRRMWFRFIRAWARAAKDGRHL
jgi:hypothetical protein